MNIQEQLKNGSNVMYVLSGGDLQEFALALISEAQKSKEAEMKNEVYLSVDEAAKELKVTRPTLWRWHRVGYLRQIKVGRKCLYRLSDINSLREGRRGA